MACDGEGRLLMSINAFLLKRAEMTDVAKGQRVAPVVAGASPALRYLIFTVDGSFSGGFLSKCRARAVVGYSYDGCNSHTRRFCRVKLCLADTGRTDTSSAAATCFSGLLFWLLSGALSLAIKQLGLSLCLE